MLIKRLIGIFSILLILQVNSNAQNFKDRKDSQVEFTYAFNKIGNWDDRTDYLVSCDDCVERYIINEGTERNSRFTYNLSLNSKNHIIGGIGVNIGQFRFDEYNTNSGTILKNQTQVYQLLDIVLGHRFLFGLKRNKTMYLENLIHNGVNINESLNEYEFRISAGLGLEFSISESISLVSSLNFNKQLNGNFARKYKYGFRIGVNCMID